MKKKYGRLSSDKKNAWKSRARICNVYGAEKSVPSLAESIPGLLKRLQVRSLFQVIEVALDQTGLPNERKLAIVDKNRDLYLVNVRKVGEEMLSFEAEHVKRSCHVFLTFYSLRHHKSDPVLQRHFCISPNIFSLRRKNVLAYAAQFCRVGALR
jgi:hypothetical protein